MKICILEPYNTGSHKAWLEGIINHSIHEITALSMPGRNWKWRMHGAAVTLAEKFKKMETLPHLILATDMLDLSSFLGLVKESASSIPTAIYFHENQLNYPWSPQDRDIAKERDWHYMFLNYISALTADSVLFNSHFHMDSFLNGLPNFLKQFPDYNEISSIESIRKKSSVLPVGIDLFPFDAHKPSERDHKKFNRPVILWNHRWEYDKNPLDFFSALIDLFKEGKDFSLVILGKRTVNTPDSFDQARTILKDRILHCGYVNNFQEYSYWLWISDILPVTSNQDFFGISIIEACYCDNIPLLPRRLSYPDLIPYDTFGEYYYSDYDELKGKLRGLMHNYRDINTSQFRDLASRFDWTSVISAYDSKFEKVIHEHAGRLNND
jgi:glycosyltransferase involved in cell wall biosynthesis